MLEDVDHTVLLNEERCELITEALGEVGAGAVVRPLTSLPASIRRSTTSECPASTAKCSGVTDASWPALMVASIAAPAASNSRTTPTCPACAATCRTATSLATWPPPPLPGMRSVARRVTSHPAATSSWTTWLCRCWAARKMGVTAPGPGRSTSHWPDSSSNCNVSVWPFHDEMWTADQPLTCTNQSEISQSISVLWGPSTRGSWHMACM